VQLTAQGQGADLQSTQNALIAAGLQVDGTLAQGADLSAQATGQVALHGQTATLQTSICKATVSISAKTV